MQNLLHKTSSETLNRKIGLKLVIALLLHEKEISIEDIKALPVQINDNDLKYIIDQLNRNFQIRFFTRKVHSKPIPKWEDFIRLISVSSK